MKVSAIHKYSHGADEVYKAFCSPDFYKKKFAAIGARNVKIIAKKKKGDTFSIKTQREVPSEAPGVLQKFLGEWNTVLQSESWEVDGKAYVNELEIESEGVPVSIEGSMHLQSTAGGCSNKIELEIECSIPFVGGKLEAFIADDVKKSLAAEYRFIKTYLAG